MPLYRIPETVQIQLESNETFQQGSAAKLRYS